jgi:hypothetical protein
MMLCCHGRIGWEAVDPPAWLQVGCELQQLNLLLLLLFLLLQSLLSCQV